MQAPFIGEVVSAFLNERNVVLHAPTGAGKSTLLPLALLQDARVQGRILLVQPRQIAARAVAERVASLFGCRIGEEVGYHVRFDRKASAKTRLLVVTDGIALQMIQRDPTLDGYDILLLDEFHERSTNLDLLLAFSRETQQALREDLRIGVLSATLEVERVKAFLDAETVDAQVRRFELTYNYTASTLPRPWEFQGWERAWARWVEGALLETSGDVLAFLPGVGEIHRLTEALEPFVREQRMSMLQLYGSMPAAAQMEALQSGDRRRIVLSTNVAETSLTVPGVDVVMDFGWVRRARLSPATGLNRLALERVSRASADQRAGRAGRLRDGVVYRAWSQFDHARLDASETPEIQRVEVSPSIMEVLRWQGRDAERFAWFEAPSKAQLGSSLSLLRSLGLVEGGAITAEGKKVAELPTHPRFGVLLRQAQRLNCVDEAALVAAILEDADFPRGFPPPRSGEESDIEHLIEFVNQRGNDSRSVRVKRVAAQFKRILSDESAVRRTGSLQAALTLAFPDRLARRRLENEPRGVMASGIGLILDDKSSVRRSEFFVALNLDASRPGELRCDCAIGLERSEIPKELWRERELYRFDDALGRVEALKQRLVGDLVLEEKPMNAADRAKISAALREAMLQNPTRWLCLNDDEIVSWVRRWELVRDYCPEEELRPIDEATWAEVIDAIAMERKNLRDLGAGEVLGALRNALGWQACQRVESLAPAKFVVPTGSAISIDYLNEGGPVLAVRLQEMFGCVDTPMILNGRKRLVLHLLAPNYRPQQVTEDLAGFWERTYPEVRKELRSRYPKHSWPDDPLSAAPQRGAKRRTT